ncbi:MAG: heterodisulfide reductase [Hyphomicrobiales bacterium]|nr:MAG: heterodisulfide reductase [Hyphomicrobiales bacterium]
MNANANIAGTAVEKFLAVTDSAIASYLEGCVHCGQCAEACHFYLTQEDARYTPTYKLNPMVKAYKRHKAPFSGLKRMFGLVPDEVTEDELNEWTELVYDSCTLCGRCTLVCPMGIDIAGSIRKMREGFTAAGLAPEGLVTAEQRAIATGSPMGITPKTLKAQVAAQERICGCEIPLDKPGVDYMVILSSMEIMGFPEIFGALARIFSQAGVTWTISTKAYEGTNVGVQIGSRETAKTLVTRVVDAAEELGVKYVISPECGHAYGALRWEGPNLVGRPFKFEVIHILELLDQLQREGRIRTTGRDERVVTLHDPCQIVRRGGVVAQPRRIMKSFSGGFVEMEHAGVTNICCGGGGGVSANPRAAELQNTAFECKKQQLDAIEGLELLVSPCANCRTVLEEALDEREIDLEVIGLAEYLAEYLEDTPKGDGSGAA